MKKFKKYIIAAVVVVVAYLLFKKNKTKIMSMVGGSGSDTVLGSVAAAFELLTEQRKTELKMIADNLFDSMSGIGMKKPEFIENMLKINSDNEYKYMNQSFGVRKRKDLASWIKKEILITNKVVNQINTDYMAKGMLTQISN